MSPGRSEICLCRHDNGKSRAAQARCTGTLTTRETGARSKEKKSGRNRMGRLDKRVALVTGAASGIGRASAKLFAAEGARVVVVDRAPEVAATAEAITKAGGKALALQCDASSEADVSKAVDTAVKEFGGLDIVFANAGISGG